MKHYGNVTKINGAEVEPVDAITFGSPCQDLSVAGKRAGIQDGERSNLFFEAVRIIKEMREATNGEYPKYAVWENVPGAFSSNKGHDFHAVLEALCSVCDDTVSIPKPYDAKRPDNLVWNKAGEIVGDNYSLCWRTLDAQFWGVPQRRKRIYLVADFTGGCAGKILFKPDSLRGNLQTSNETGQSATADVVGGVDGSVRAAGVVSKGNGECFIMPERHMSLSVGGGQAGQGYPCTVYSFDSLSSNSMKSSNPFSGCRAAEVAKCIDTTYPDPSKNQGEMAIVMATQQGGAEIAENLCPTITAAAGMSGNNQPVIAFAQNQRDEVRDLGDKAGALAAEAGVHQQTYVAQPVIALQANGIDRADTAGCNGCGWRENESYTLNTVDRHAVCYGIDQQGGKGGANYSENTMPPMCSDSHGTPHAVCYQGQVGALQARDYKGVGSQYVGEDNLVVECYDARGNGDGERACYTMQRSDEYRACNVASTQSARQYKSATDLVVEKKRKYIIRRLTPTECCRLQGFPDCWADLAPYNPDDAEFWEDVRKTHAEINGKKYKPTKNLKKWYEGLHTDSAEYKAYGNGLALPCAEYVIHGIAEQGAKTLGSLFDGIGGFPLAGVLNGITPLWASEVEPFPIAVTKSRFAASAAGRKEK